MLDITDDDMRKKFMDGVRNIAAICLNIGYPTVASVPHSLINGFKNLLAVAAETDITFKEAEKVIFLFNYTVKAVILFYRDNTSLVVLLPCRKERSKVG